MTLNEKMLDKVRKLLALAERAGTEEEAANAMTRVQEILAKYNLDIGDVKIDDVAAGMAEETMDVAWNQSWIKYVATGIGRLYFCKVLVQTHSTDYLRLFFTGRAVNIMTAKYVLETVLRAGRKAALDFARQQNKLGFNSVSASNNFKKGFGVRVFTRCEGLIREAKLKGLRDADTNTMLPVANLYDQEQRAAENFLLNKGVIPRTGNVKMKGTNYDHMAAGSSAADNVNLTATGAVGGRGKGLYLPKE